MTCEHCEHVVSSEHGNLDGVRDVTVELSPGSESAATVTRDALLAAALDEVGGCQFGG